MARRSRGIYAAKGRPRFNPLISHVADGLAALRLARFTDEAELLAGVFWPGPLTLVLPKQPGCPVSDLATAGLDSIAVRVPDHTIARDLLKAFGKPVVAPSANQSGHVSPTVAEHVHADLEGRVDLIIDGGADQRRRRVHHRVVSSVRRRLLRPGGLPRDDDRARARLRAGRCRAGRTTKHRSRRACCRRTTRRARRVRLNATDVRPGEALLAFGDALPPGAATTLNLSSRGDLVEAAANLFSHLRALDASGARHRRDADPERRSRRGHQRPPDACAAAPRP